MEETKNKKGKTIAIVILIVLLVALGAYTTYDKLVLDKNTGETSHHVFKEIIDYLNQHFF